MKKLIFGILSIALIGNLSIPVSYAQYKDCWGNWHSGTPGPGTCYSSHKTNQNTTKLTLKSWKSGSGSNRHYLR